MVPEYSIPPKKVIQEEIAAQKQIDILEERALQEITDIQKEYTVQKQTDMQNERALQELTDMLKEHTVQEQTDMQKGCALQKLTNMQEERTVQEQTDIQNERTLQELTDMLKVRTIQEQTNIRQKPSLQEKSSSQEETTIPEESSIQEQTATYKGTTVPEKTTTKKPTSSCPAGVFLAHKKDGTPYYRSSITYRGKHISLGSYQNAHTAHSVYLLASRLLNEKNTPLAGCTVDDHPSLGGELPFEKWVCLLNFRDNGIYCHTPIYLQNRFFLYYLAPSTPLKFDADDLFYYMRRKIMQRGGHLFVSDYGMQVSILSRYGIHSHAVAGRDYRFVNGDSLDYRYSNIEIINHYHGVTKRLHRGHDIFTARIHINGNYLVGRYLSEAEAAIAYNKAADYLNRKGFVKNYPRNYIEELSEREYAKLYAAIRIGRKIRDYPDKINLSCN